MEKSIIDGQNKSVNFFLPLNDITCLTVQNFGSTVINGTLNETAFTLPAFQAGKTPPSFSIDEGSTYFDARLSVEFDTGSGNATVWYKQIVHNNCK